MQTNAVPQINLLNLAQNHASVIALQLQPLVPLSHNSETKTIESFNQQQKSQNHQSAFQFQQPSFLKSFEEYLSGHFRLIQTHFTSINHRFNHFDSITSQMKHQISSLQQQLQSHKIHQQTLINQLKSQKQVPYLYQNTTKTQNNPQYQNQKSQKQVSQVEVGLSLLPEEKQQRKKDESILIKLVQIEKRISQLQKANAKQNQPFNFQITQEFPSRLIAQPQKPQISSDLINHQFNLINKEPSDPQISKNLYDILNKKIYQLQNSFGHLEHKVKEQMQNKNKPIEAFAYEVQSLKNQLQEFKFKREAKYLKMMSKESSVSVDFTTFNQAKKSGSHQDTNQNSVQEYLTYLSQKVQFLMATNKEFLPKQVYEFEIEHIHEVLSAIRKRLSEKVNYQDLSKVHSIEEISNLKKPDHNTRDEVGMSNNDSNVQKLKEISTEKSDIKVTSDQIKQVVEVSQPHRFGISVKQQSSNDSYVQQSQNPQKEGLNNTLLIQIQAKLDSHEEFLKNMNKFYNQKLNLIEINIQKITSSNQQTGLIQDPNPTRSLSSSLLESSQLSQQPQVSEDPISYNLKNHLNSKNQLSPISEPQSPSNFHIVHSLNQQKKPEQIQSQQMYNFEFTNIRKKISKLNGKHDFLEGNVKNFRQEIMKYIELVQKNDQNKTDWESFKKAVKYFDQKIKELQKTITKFLQIQNEQNSSHQQGLESSPSQIAAKKKWSCLLCDKEFKNYEGRTSEIRYMGVASGAFKHESPRAVSYMKQSQRQKQYEKIYMKSPLNNEPANRDSGIRKRSLSKSKQYMKHLNQKISFFDHQDNQRPVAFNHLN